MKKVTLLALTAMMLPAAVTAAGGASPEAPANLVAKPDAKGLLKATITMTAPTLTVEGNALTDITKIELLRGGNVIQVFNTVAPGENCEYVDLSVDNGYTTYSAIAYTSAGASDEAQSDRVFIGVDTPLPPKQLKAATEDGKISFTWPKVEKKGVNGERVGQDGVTYILEALNDSYEPQSRLTETKGQAYDYYIPFNTGAQDLKRFGLRASNRTGMSDYVYAKVVVGAPFNYPYHESFAGGVAHGLVWQEGDGTFTMVTDESADADAGALKCTPDPAGKATSFNFGKISMKNTLNPRLSLQVSDLGEGESLLVRVARADGAEATLLTVNGPVMNWKEYTVDLSVLKNEAYIIPKFQLAASNTTSCYIDDVRLEDPYDMDFALLVDAPEYGAGPTPVNILVENVGMASGSGATIDIFQNGEKTHTLTVEEQILPGDTLYIPTEVNVSGEDSFEVKAVLHWLLDLNPANDTASAQIIPEEPMNFGPSAGIDEAASVATDHRIFMLDGREVTVQDPAQLAPGIYVIDGRKVIIK